MGLPNNLDGIQSRIKFLAGNISASKGLGVKEQETLFNVSYADNGNVSYVQTTKRMNISERGPLTSTGNNGDIALSKGNGMFVFKQNATDGDNGEFRFKSTASLRVDKDGYLSTGLGGDGYKLFAHKIDEDGNLPTVTSLLSSLVAANVKDVVLRPEATTVVSVNRLRLDSNTTPLHGPGDVISVNRGNLNANLKIKDIIIPEENNFSSLKQGDRLSLLSNPPGGQPQLFEYGGIVISKKINSGAGGFYGRTTTGGQFTFAANGVAQTPANLLQNNGINISFNGNTINLRASTDGSDQTFSSLEGLKDAINKFVPGLSAKIQDGRIFIAPNDTVDANAGNGPIQFTNSGGGNLVSTLGLINTTAAAVGVNRFATLKVLQDRVNLNNNTTGLKADFIGSKLDLHALIASSTLDLDGDSIGGPYTFNRARIGTAYQGDTQERTRATLTIEAPKHQLKEGDFVQIAGAGNAQFGDGRYMVTRAEADNFSVEATNPDVANFPLAGTNIVGANGSWQKIAGEVRPEQALTVIATANAVVTVTTGGFAARDYVNGDIVYVSGAGGFHQGGDNYDMPDGYYTIGGVNQGAGTFTITLNANNHAAGAAADATHQAPIPQNITVKKVGLANNNPRVMTTRAAENVPADTIRLFLPSTNYNISDSFRMLGLPNNAPLVVDGMTITEGDEYTVTGKDPNGNWIEFQPPLTGPTAGNVDSNYVGNAGDVGPDFRLDNYGLTSKYLGLKNQTATTFNATYSRTDPNLSISNMNANSKHIGKTFDTTIKVVDSLGAEHTLIMTFARLEDNHWTVEVAGVPNKDGSYDFVTTRADGVIAAGDIFFDENANFSNSTLNTLDIDWTVNGSAPSNIALDWNDVLSGRGIIQPRATSFAEDIKANGHVVGTIVNFEFDDDGIIYCVLDDGQRIAAFQAAIAMFPNIDGLEGTTDGFFIPGPFSGAVNLHLAGKNGAPLVLSKVLEGSNISDIKSILTLNETSNDYRANIAIVTTNDTLTKEAIAKVGSV